jgi:hypothetical protein
VIVTIVADVTSVPVPPAPVHHPAKVYPARVVVARVPYVRPFVTVILVGLAVVPPCALNVIVAVVTVTTGMYTTLIELNVAAFATFCVLAFPSFTN